MNKGIKFVGLQFGGECWGGKTKGKYIKYNDDGKCDMLCTEDPEYTCGSAWTNSVYSIADYVDEGCTK